MKNTTRNAVTAWLTTFTLALSMVAGIMTCDRASASASSHPNHIPQKKASSDLIEKAHGAHSADPVKVIVQLNAPMSGQLNALLNRNGVHGAKKIFDKLNAQLIEMPANIVEAVAGFDEVAFVSPDRPTQSTGHLSATTGADLVRAPKSVTTTTTTALGTTLTSVTTVPGLDGSGIGVAIMDSGIYKQHTDFLDKAGIGRVIYSKDFTGENRTDDPYGHGSHVAATAGGNGRVSNSAYLGIAPNVNLINVRVLNSQGTGNVSDTLAGLNWILANRQAYNIRVVNMSLGTAAIDSYRNDPVCKAVRALVNAGVVVVCAAGNNGKN